MYRTVLFHEPGPPRVNEIGEPVEGEPITHRVQCTREDRGGTEGFVTEAVLGGEWQRRYRCSAYAFPPGHRPTERWVLEEEGEQMRIRSVDELTADSPRLPPRLEILAYRTRS